MLEKMEDSNFVVRGRIKGVKWSTYFDLFDLFSSQKILIFLDQNLSQGSTLITGSTF